MLMSHDSFLKSLFAATVEQQSNSWANYGEP